VNQINPIVASPQETIAVRALNQYDDHNKLDDPKPQLPSPRNPAGSHDERGLAGLLTSERS